MIVYLLISQMSNSCNLSTHFSAGLFIETSLKAEAAAFLSSSSSETVEIDDTSSAIARTSLVAENLGALWAPPGIRALVQARLNQVTCDGETILITLPVDHRLGTAAESSALGRCIIFVVIFTVRLIESIPLNLRRYYCIGMCLDWSHFMFLIFLPSPISY
jgi:hypothetical protein